MREAQLSSSQNVITQLPYSRFSDPAEVEINRHGEITPRQRSAILAKTGEIGLIALMLTLLGLGGGWLLFSAFSKDIAPTSSQAVTVLILCGAFLLVVASPFLLKAAQLWTRVYYTWRDTSAKAIRQAVGHVTWTGDIYSAKSKRRSLHPIYNKLNLLPGEYHFFYLARSGWLLSAHSSLPLGAEQVRSQLQQALAQANRFGPSVLAINREGHLARQQIPILLRTLLFFLALAIPATLFVLPILLLNDISAILSDSVTQLFIVAYGFTMTYSLWQVLKIIVDIILRQVNIVEGIGHRLRRVYDRRGRLVLYYYQINGQQFRVSRQGYNALITGIAYRLYYSRRSKIVVGIEPSEPQGIAPFWPPTD